MAEHDDLLRAIRQRDAARSEANHQARIVEGVRQVLREWSHERGAEMGVGNAVTALLYISKRVGFYIARENDRGHRASVQGNPAPADTEGL